MKTRLSELLGIAYPIFQGAMAWISDADLASAVSNAGGLGILGTGTDSVETVKAEIELLESKTKNPYAVNLMLLNPHIDELVDFLVTSDVKIVTTGAGDPSKYMERFNHAGIRVIPVVSSVALARRMERIGATAVIVEGMEAGGHIGKLTTMALIPQVVDAVDIPVIAAGGIADGRGVAASLMLGAEGVQLGTLFSVAKESNAHRNFKEAIIKARDISTVITGEMTGHPVRVLRNKLAVEFVRLEKELSAQTDPDLNEFEILGQGALRRSVVEGDVHNGSVMTGQIAGLVQSEKSCHEIIQDLVTSAKSCYQSKVTIFTD